jgi:hypothetical protein
MDSAIGLTHVKAHAAARSQQSMGIHTAGQARERAAHFIEFFLA